MTKFANSYLYEVDRGLGVICQKNGISRADQVQIV